MSGPRLTPLSYLNTQTAQIPELSTNVSFLDTAFTFFSTTVVPNISSTAGETLSSFTIFADNFSTFSTLISTTIGKFPDVSTSVSTITSLFEQNSTIVSTLVGQGIGTSNSISTLTSTTNAALAGSIGGAALSTAFYLPLTGFSTVYGSNFSTINSTIRAVSTIDGQQTSTLNIVSTINGQQTSTINNVSTLTGQSASTLNAQSTLNGEQAITLSNVQISTQVLQYGARPLQAFNGVYTDASWGSGSNSKQTSTIMNLQAGLTAAGSGSVGDSNSVSLINNTTVSTTMLPLFIGVSGQGIPTYPASANQILRFAHSGAPGSNSSIIINLTTGGTASDAIEMNAGEVVTLVYAGGSATDPANYYYFPTL